MQRLPPLYHQGRPDQGCESSDLNEAGANLQRAGCKKRHRNKQKEKVKSLLERRWRVNARVAVLKHAQLLGTLQNIAGSTFSTSLHLQQSSQSVLNNLRGRGRNFLLSVMATDWS
jgi:hypothetical protein